jgi:hypothetical protein
MSINPDTVEKMRQQVARQRQRAAQVRIENARKAGRPTPNLLSNLKKKGA